MAMALHVAADHRAVEDVHRGEKRRCAVPLVVVRHGPGATLLQRQSRLCAIKRLNLRFFRRPTARWRVRADHVNIRDRRYFLDERRVVAQLELTRSVPRTMAPNAFEPTCAEPDIAALSFEERIGLMVDREAAERDTKRSATRLKFAALRQNAVVEDVDLRTPRGIDRALFQKLVAGDWIDRAEGLLITGPPASAKAGSPARSATRLAGMGEASSTIGRRACSRPWRSPSAMAASAACSKPSLASSS